MAATVLGVGEHSSHSTPHYLSTLPHTAVLLPAAQKKLGHDSVVHQEGVLPWITRTLLGDRCDHVAAFGMQGLSRWDFPRGLAWRDYPYLDDVRLKPVTSHEADTAVDVILAREGRTKVVYKAEFRRVLASARNVVVALFCDEGTEPDEDWEGMHIARTWDFLRNLRQGDDPRIVLIRTGREPLGMDLADFGAMAAPYLPYQRFRYSYAASAGAVIGKALRQAVVPAEICHDHVADQLLTRVHNGEGADLSQAGTAALLASGDIGALADPITLQMLFRVRRLVALPSPQVSEDILYGWRGLVEAVAGGEPNWRGQVAWHGTGRHEALLVDAGRIRDGLSTLLRYGLVYFSHVQREVRLSPAGERFLGLMHNDNEDPDVVVRWRGPADAATKDAMDDWIRRHFRKMKNTLAKAGGEPEGHGAGQEEGSVVAMARRARERVEAMSPSKQAFLKRVVDQGRMPEG